MGGPFPTKIMGKYKAEVYRKTRGEQRKLTIQNQISSQLRRTSKNEQDKTDRRSLWDIAGLRDRNRFDRFRLSLGLFVTTVDVAIVDVHTHTRQMGHGPHSRLGLSRFLTFGFGLSLNARPPYARI
jgi:hypothetical protein